MKALYWIVGILALAFVIYYGFYYEVDTNTLGQPSTTSSDNPSVYPTDNQDDNNTVNTIDDPNQDIVDISSTDNYIANPVPKLGELRTYSKEDYGFAFDYDKNFYWEESAGPSIHIVNDNTLMEYSYQGYLADSSRGFR